MQMYTDSWKMFVFSNESYAEKKPEETYYT